MNLNAVQLDMLFLANKNMKHFERTWYNYPRDAEVGWLKRWHGRIIGLSWLDDNRGILKKNGWVRRWQSGKRGDGGSFRGSEARGQFTWKTVCALASRGIVVFRGVYALAKRSIKPAPSSTATRREDLKTQSDSLRKPGYNPFADSTFRKKKGFKSDLPLEPESK